MNLTVFAGILLAVTMATARRASLGEKTMQAAGKADEPDEAMREAARPASLVEKIMRASDEAEEPDEAKRESANMYAQSGLITELMDKAPPKVLKITYAGNNILDQNTTGKDNTPTQVRYQPLSIVWPDMKSNHYYTLIMIDPDMPSRTTPIEQKTQVLHWLMVNIPGAGVGGRQLAPYIGSGPPPGTGIHRYTFLVFDEGISPKDYTSVEPVDLVQIIKRVNWNFVQPGKPWTLREFISWANMGLPIAGNFYQAQWDSWVDQLWKTFDQYYEVMCPEKTCEKVYECRKKCKGMGKPKEHCKTTCYYSANVKEITSPCKCK